jgi:hypothetical protein
LGSRKSLYHCVLLRVGHLPSLIALDCKGLAAPEDGISRQSGWSVSTIGAAVTSGSSEDDANSGVGSARHVEFGTRIDDASALRGKTRVRTRSGAYLLQSHYGPYRELTQGAIHKLVPENHSIMLKFPVRGFARGNERPP